MKETWSDCLSTAAAIVIAWTGCRVQGVPLERFNIRPQHGSLPLPSTEPEPIAQRPASHFPTRTTRATSLPEPRAHHCELRAWN
eukprot:702820-Prymnesium_polylepis.1